MRLPDHIIAASSQTGDRLRASLGSKARITTVPTGIDLEAIAEVAPAPYKFDIVTVGRLIAHKRVELLLDVIARLRAEGRNATCLIIGDGPERGYLEQKIHALNISKLVQIRSDVTEQKELYSLIKSGQLFVSLSEREGFGIAVLEAIACGLPVLSTSTPDNLARYLVNQYSKGTICEPVIDDITTAIDRLLSEKGTIHATHARADLWLTGYDWGVVIDRVHSVYSECIGEGS